MGGGNHGQANDDGQCAGHVENDREEGQDAQQLDRNGVEQAVEQREGCGAECEEMQRVRSVVEPALPGLWSTGAATHPRTRAKSIHPTQPTQPTQPT